MGAFGELLIQYWGGDLATYRGDKKACTCRQQTNTEEKEETEEEKEIRRKQFWEERKIAKAREPLDRLTNNILYDFIDYTKITEKWFKDCYTNGGYSKDIADMMWVEYVEWINKYKK